MSYADSLLASGERIVRREHQHWFVLLWNARLAILAVLFALILLWLRTQMDTETASGPVGTIAGLLTAALLIGGLIGLGWSYLRYRTEEYVITTRRIIHAEGVINKKTTDSSLEKINDAQLVQSWVGRLFGFGDLDIMTASESGIEKLRMLIDALGFKKAMVEAKHELEIELSRPVMPPLRATAPGESAGGGAAAAPAAMSATDVTSALDRLADLRERGAITPEEFERKKAELLSRL